MTNEKAKKIILARIDCMEWQMAGWCTLDGRNCNICCHLLDEVGTQGEFVEALKLACDTLDTKDRKRE